MANAQDPADKAGSADVAATENSHNQAFIKHISDYLEKHSIFSKGNALTGALGAAAPKDADAKAQRRYGKGPSGG
jgi:hypothetical protein